MEATRAGGTVAVLGTLTGLRGEIDTSRIIMKRLRLVGVYVGSREECEAMNRFIEQHAITPVIDHTFSFAELLDALRYMESGQHVGKIVVQV
jgi:D-arabinose 1-dehydrogenase-like Zn-dependent alcohol dehydrogenase